MVDLSFIFRPIEILLVPLCLLGGGYVGLSIASPAKAYKYANFPSIRNVELTGFGEYFQIVGGFATLILFLPFAIHVGFSLGFIGIFYAAAGYVIHDQWPPESLFENLSSAYGNPTLEDEY